jgi:hypothetical protein
MSHVGANCDELPSRTELGDMGQAMSQQGREGSERLNHHLRNHVRMVSRGVDSRDSVLYYYEKRFTNRRSGIAI